MVTYIQPSHSREGDWLAALAYRRMQRQCHPQLLVPTRSFHEPRCTMPFGSEATQAKGWLKVPTMILCETRGL